jgi:hypothetical protein
MTPTDQSSSGGSTIDLWRNYRIGVGVLTALFGVLAANFVYGIQMVFALFTTVFGFLTMSNMGGSPPSMSTDPSALTIMIGVVGFAIFGSAGYRFARNGSDGRISSWIAAILSLPFGVGVISIWVLTKTAPGTNHTPPGKRTVLAAAAGVAIFATVYVVPIAMTEFNQRRERLERQESEFIELVDRQNGEELRVLLEQGADPNQTTKLGTPALILALENGDYRGLDVVLLLLEFGADPNTASRWQKDAIWEGVVKSKQHEDRFIWWLNNNGGTTRQSDGNPKHTPLVIAASWGNLEVVELMIDKGADVNAHQAHIEENAFINHLIERGANHYTNNRGPKPELSPIATAIECYLTRRCGSEGKYEDVVRSLLSHGAAVDPELLSRFEYASSMR